MKTKQQSLKISGVQKTSLIDYPENIAAVIFTQGCNFRCPYCHNPELITAENNANNYMDIDMFLEFLGERENLLDGVCITGGEPLLQEGLYDFIKKIKVKGLKVKLDTNGSQPDKLKLLIENNLLNYIAMDVKLPLPSYHLVLATEKASNILIKNIKKSISLILNSEINYEFRTTVVPGMHEVEDIKKIALSIEGADTYYLQNFRPENTLDPELEKLHRFSPAKLKKFKAAAEEILVSVEIRD